MAEMDVEELRIAVYLHFATTGRAPTIDDLAAALATEPGPIRDGLRGLPAHGISRSAPTTAS